MMVFDKSNEFVTGGVILWNWYGTESL